MIEATVKRASALTDRMPAASAYAQLAQMLNQMLFDKHRVTGRAFGERIFPLHESLKEYDAALFASKPAR